MVATHDLDQAARHFDRIMLLNQRIVAFGRPKRYCRQKIFCAPMVAGCALQTGKLFCQWMIAAATGNA
jgi:ABC-type Mn2+/Zn2+ transport system ATPase subunit